MVRIGGCGNCTVVRPCFLEARKRSPAVSFITIERDDNPEVMAWLNEREKIREAPAFKKIRSGMEIGRKTDMQRPGEIVEALM